MRGRTSWAVIVGALLVGAACQPYPPPDDRGGGNNNCTGFCGDINLNPGGPTGLPGGGGTTPTSCEPLVRIGVAEHGGTGNRDVSIAVGGSKLLDATGHGASGPRNDNCNAATPIGWEVTQGPGPAACELRENPSNRWTPTVVGLANGTCTIKAVSGSIRSSDAEDVNVSVGTARTLAWRPPTLDDLLNPPAPAPRWEHTVGGVR